MKPFFYELKCNLFFVCLDLFGKFRIENKTRKTLLIFSYCKINKKLR